MSRTAKKKSADVYHHGDLRHALVNAALSAIERRGVDDLSLRALARTLRVSPRAPYRHFATKEDLLAAVAVEGFRMFARFSGERMAAAGDNPASRLRAAGQAYVEFAVRHRAAFRVMYAPYATVMETAPELVRVRTEGHARMLQVIADGQKAGALREADPMHIALAWWSITHGLAVLLIEGQLGRYDRPVDAPKLAKLVGTLLYEGLRP